MANDFIKIKVIEVVGSPVCTSPRDGDKVNAAIEQAFAQGCHVTLSFAEVRYVISAFLNTAIGRLYKNHDGVFLNGHLKIEEVTPEQRALIGEVARNAREYYLNPEGVEARRREVLDGY